MGLMDLYHSTFGSVKTASMEKTSEEVRLEKVGMVSDQVFNAAVDDYLMKFVLTDLSR